MQNIGQTTAVQFGNALDPRGRANHPKPACARAHGNQVGTVLAKDQSVWSSRNIYTLITGHTPPSLSRKKGQPPVLTSPNRISTLPKRFACARLSQSYLPESCSGFSATFTTVA